MGNFTLENKRFSKAFVAVLVACVALFVCTAGEAQAAPKNEMYLTTADSAFITGTPIEEDTLGINQQVYVQKSSEVLPEFNKQGVSSTPHVIYLFPGQQVHINYVQDKTEWMRFQTDSPCVGFGDADQELDNDGAVQSNHHGRVVKAKNPSSIYGEMAEVNLQKWGIGGYKTKETFKIYVMPQTVDVSLYTNIVNQLPAHLNTEASSNDFIPSPDVEPVHATVDLQLAAADYPLHFFYFTDKAQHISLSIDNYKNRADVANRAKAFYRTALEPYFTPETKKFVDNTFGVAAFGYVLKYEGYGNGYWHLDGILANDPPNYIVSMSEQTSDGSFQVLGRETVTYKGDVAHSYDAIHKTIYTKDSSNPSFENTLARVTGKQYTFAGWSDQNYPIYQYSENGQTFQQTVLPQKRKYSNSNIIKDGNDNFYFEYNQPDPRADNYVCEIYLTAPQLVITNATINVTKKVTGIGGDENKDFDFYLEIDEDALDILNAGGGINPQDYSSLLSVLQRGIVFTQTFPDGRPAEQWTDSFLNYQENGRYTGQIPFKLKHGEQVSIDVQVLPGRVQPSGGSANLPEFNYRVQERAIDGQSRNPIYLTVKMFTGEPSNFVEVPSTDITHYEPIGTSGALRYKNIIPQADTTFNLLFENNFNPPMAGYKNGDVAPYVVSMLILLGSVGLVLALRVLKRRRGE